MLPPPQSALFLQKPEWIRTEFASKDPVMRTRAEDALAACSSPRSVRARANGSDQLAIAAELGCPAGVDLVREREGSHVELGRLSAGEDGLRDGGRPERQPQDPGKVGTSNALPAGERLDLHFTSAQLRPPAMRACTSSPTSDGLGGRAGPLPACTSRSTRPDRVSRASSRTSTSAGASSCCRALSRFAAALVEQVSTTSFDVTRTSVTNAGHELRRGQLCHSGGAAPPS